MPVLYSVIIKIQSDKKSETDVSLYNATQVLWYVHEIASPF
jgi:hypothetical protein